MRKFLKLLLATSLLCMVFTSTVFAEGSVSVGDLKPGAEPANPNVTLPDGFELRAREIGNDYVISNETSKAVFEDVNGEELSDFASLVQVSKLDPDTKKAMGLTDAGTDVYMTKFLDIYEINGKDIPEGGVWVTVDLNESLLSKANLVSVIHIKDNGDIETIKYPNAFRIEGTTKIKFKITSLSPFSFVFQYKTNAGSGSTTNPPVVNTAAGDINNTNSYMAYAAVACVAAAGVLFVAGKKLIKNAK